MKNTGLMLLVLILLFLPVTGLANPAPAPVGVTADEILAQMTPEERIGQLVLVTFSGSTVEQGSSIDRLIREHHISGVVLRQEQDNFLAAPNTAIGVRQLVSELQTVEYNSSLNEIVTDPVTGAERASVYVPLFVGLSDEEAGVPISQLIDGLSPFPTQMALGATWNPELARETGFGLGQELSSLGVNLYLGPSLDVLEKPGQAGPGDLGTRSFGGDPYWVSEMGKAYIEGLHEGSGNTLAVVAKHFPGHGGSDRPVQQEVATVRKSLDQLLQIELPPFFSVTSEAPGASSEVTDGLLISHIRYQGFQGNIRETTRPISLDPDAYSQLMELAPIQS
ncbi:MAG: glycoside hydrolase family 3 N-terminal domain-containing protein, partial [Anaerolineales bacterium]